jgi:hypothetical protein
MDIFLEKAMSSQTKRSFEYLDVLAISNSRTEIFVNVKNIGTVEAIIARILIDGKPLISVNGGRSNPRTPIYLKPGGSEKITLTFSSPLALGITNVIIHTHSGREYPKVVDVQ